jgi:hypothetical protein
VIGGGVQLDDVNMTSVVDGYPDLTSTAWTAHVANDDPKKAYGFIVTAICVASAAAGTTGPTGPTAPAG